MDSLRFADWQNRLASCYTTTPTGTELNITAAHRLMTGSDLENAQHQFLLQTLDLQLLKTLNPMGLVAQELQLQQAHIILPQCSPACAFSFQPNGRHDLQSTLMSDYIRERITTEIVENQSRPLEFAKSIRYRCRCRRQLGQISTNHVIMFKNSNDRGTNSNCWDFGHCLSFAFDSIIRTRCYAVVDKLSAYSRSKLPQLASVAISTVKAKSTKAALQIVPLDKKPIVFDIKSARETGPSNATTSDDRVFSILYWANGFPIRFG